MSYLSCKVLIIIIYITKFFKSNLNIKHSQLLYVSFRSETFDVERIKQGTQLFLGLKDFRTFAGNSKKLTNVKYVRNLNSLTVEKAQPLMPFDELSTNFDYWHIVVSSKGFLYNQVIYCRVKNFTYLVYKLFIN